MASPIDIHKAGLAKVRLSEEFSDCKIICGPYHFNLHKVILATQSDYFKAAFKANTFEEGQSGVIKLQAANQDEAEEDGVDHVCDDPEMVKLMIEYFYHYDYVLGFDMCDLHSEMVAHANMFALAVKYQVEGLRDIAVTRFRDAVCSKAAWRHQSFPKVISLVHASTAEDVAQLRDIIADVLHDHSDELVDKVGIEDAVCNIPRLAYALLKRSRGKKAAQANDVSKRTHQFHCLSSSCGRVFSGTDAATFYHGGRCCPFCYSAAVPW